MSALEVTIAIILDRGHEKHKVSRDTKAVQYLMGAYHEIFLVFI